MAIDDRSRTFNTELTSALELSYMLDVAQTIVQSALERRESRGSHQRTDYPERDDTGYLAHSLAYRGDERRPADRLPAGHDHALASGPARLREVGSMADTVTL